MLTILLGNIKLHQDLILLSSTLICRSGRCQMSSLIGLQSIVTNQLFYPICMRPHLQNIQNKIHVEMLPMGTATKKYWKKYTWDSHFKETAVVTTALLPPYQSRVKSPSLTNKFNTSRSKKNKFNTSSCWSTRRWASALHLTRP